MDLTPNEPFRDEIAMRSPQDASYATEVVDLVVMQASKLRASDIHLQPTAEGMEIRWRIDGVLGPALRSRRRSPPRS